MPPPTSRACPEVTALPGLYPGPYVGMPDGSATGTMAAILVKLEPRRDNIQVNHTVYPFSQNEYQPDRQHLVLIGAATVIWRYFASSVCILCPAWR